MRFLRQACVRNCMGLELSGGLHAQVGIHANRIAVYSTFIYHNCNGPPRVCSKLKMSGDG